VPQQLGSVLSGLVSRPRTVNSSNTYWYSAIRSSRLISGVQSQAWLDMDDRNREDCFSKTTPLQYFGCAHLACTPENKTWGIDAWKPTAQLLATCAGLKDFYWASTDEVLRCVLDMLHNDLPRSRLHVHTLSVRSLFQERDRLHDMDDDEYALATSPSLYSVCTASIYLHSDGNLYYNEEAARGGQFRRSHVSWIYVSIFCADFCVYYYSILRFVLRNNLLQCMLQL
jgi:hypothetical protein